MPNTITINGARICGPIRLVPPRYGSEEWTMEAEYQVGTVLGEDAFQPVPHGSQWQVTITSHGHATPVELPFDPAKTGFDHFADLCALIREREKLDADDLVFPVIQRRRRSAARSRRT